MPDRGSSGAGLDVRLADGRTDLLDSIDQPPLARIRDRAAARRRRRRTAGTGSAGLLCVAVAATLLLQPWTADGTDPLPPPVAEAPPGGPVYTGAGITINGLTESAVTQVPGTISDVEFVDPDHGYVLASCAEPCPVNLARTGDGGLTWQYSELPAASAGLDDPDLVAFPDGRLVVTADNDGYVSTDQGRTWRVTGLDGGTGRVPVTADDLLRAGPGGGRCGLDVEVWRPELPRAGVPPAAPDLDVCWVAPAVTADGAWWVGGTRDGGAAVAVTRDRGTSWHTVELPGTGIPAGQVEVASLGSQAYAVVLDTDRTMRALFHSTDGGRSFTRSAAAGVPRGLAGAVVPLLDGRLLATGADQYLYVSTDDGATFSQAGGNLPVTGRLTRTTAGYVAYNLFGAGWAAFSTDGATWRKLQLN